MLHIIPLELVFILQFKNHATDVITIRVSCTPFSNIVDKHLARRGHPAVTARVTRSLGIAIVSIDITRCIRVEDGIGLQCHVVLRHDKLIQVNGIITRIAVIAILHLSFPDSPPVLLQSVEPPAVAGNLHPYGNGIAWIDTRL